jgi:4-hydroxybenzoate polyprenyltransferase
MSFATVLKVSRPRFWHYTAGTFLIGSLFGMVGFAGLLSPWFIVHFLFFLWFANVFIYGVNDWFDRDTDAFNPKKDAKEHRVQRKEKRELFFWLYLSFFVAIVLNVVWFSPVLLVLWLCFFFLSFFYSVPPLRFKAFPFVDFLSNALYLFPGFIGYYFASGSLPSFEAVIAGWAWVGGMQLFSAIPDIVADKRAKLRTTAVVLGFVPSLLLTSALWLVAVVFGLFVLPWWFLLGVVYPLMPLLVLLLRLDIEKVYWWFPYVNLVMGFLLFVGGVVA